jgi:hypothetical protein
MIDIEKLAREAAKDHPDFDEDVEAPEPELLAFFQRFAALVLEEAAKCCDEKSMFASCASESDTIYDCAHAIRALKQ